MINKVGRYACMEETNYYMMYNNNISENLRMMKFQKLKKGMTIRPEEISKEL